MSKCVIKWKIIWTFAWKTQIFTLWVHSCIPNFSKTVSIHKFLLCLHQKPPYSNNKNSQHQNNFLQKNEISSEKNQILLSLSPVLTLNDTEVEVLSPCGTGTPSNRLKTNAKIVIDNTVLIILYFFYKFKTNVFLCAFPIALVSTESKN